MKTKTLLASLAVVGLAFAQPVAAATRSYESLPAKGVQSADVERTGSVVAEAEATAGNNLWLIFAGLALTVLLIAVASGGSKSPG